MSALLDLTPGTQLRQEAVDASPPPGSAGREWRSTTSYVLFALSLLLVWALVYLLGLSGLEQARTQDRLYQDLRTQLAEGTAPIEAPIEAGAPVALLSIPSADVDDLVVVEGTRTTQLQAGPGHSLGSVLPGQAGVSVLAGRSTTFGAPFGSIADLPRGARIVVTTGQGRFTYEVTDVRRKGDDQPPLLAAGEGRLTLLTSDGSGISAAETVYVDAELTSEPATSTARSSKDPDARIMSAGLDAPTLALLALSLQLLGVVLAAFAYAWRRWSRTATWISLAPCVLAALWLCSSLGSRLLPGLV